jgi:hypothetical protein
VSTLRDSTAVRTPFGRAIGIDPVQLNAAVETAPFKNPSEYVRRNGQNFFVECPSLGLELREALDRNISIEPARKEDYLPDHLTQIRVNEVSLSVPHPLELLQSLQGPEHCSPLGEMYLCRPDVLAEITLLEYLAFSRQNGIGEILVVDVYSEYVLLVLNLSLLFFLGQESCDLKRRRQSVCLADPSLLQQGLESDKIQILLDRNRDPISRIHPKLNKEETSFCLECLAVSGEIELDCGAPDMLAFFLLVPNGSGNVADDLNVESTSLLCFHCNGLPKVVEFGMVGSLKEKTVSFGGGLFLKLGQKILFESGSHRLKENRSLHPNAGERISQAITSVFPSSLLPPLKGVGFRSEMV